MIYALLCYDHLLGYHHCMCTIATAMPRCNRCHCPLLPLLYITITATVAHCASLSKSLLSPHCHLSLSDPPLAQTASDTSPTTATVTVTNTNILHYTNLLHTAYTCSLYTRRRENVKESQWYYNALGTLRFSESHWCVLCTILYNLYHMIVKGVVTLVNGCSGQDSGPPSTSSGTSVELQHPINRSNTETITQFVRSLSMTIPTNSNVLLLYI